MRSQKYSFCVVSLGMLFYKARLSKKLCYFMIAKGAGEALYWGHFHKTINMPHLYVVRVFSLFFFFFCQVAALSMNSSIYKTSMLEMQRKEYICCESMTTAPGPEEEILLPAKLGVSFHHCWWGWFQCKDITRMTQQPQSTYQQEEPVSRNSFILLESCQDS